MRGYAFARVDAGLLCVGGTGASSAERNENIAFGTDRCGRRRRKQMKQLKWGNESNLRCKLQGGLRHSVWVRVNQGTLPPAAAHRASSTGSSGQRKEEKELVPSGGSCKLWGRTDRRLSPRDWAWLIREPPEIDVRNLTRRKEQLHAGYSA